jgi:transposase
VVVESEISTLKNGRAVKASKRGRPAAKMDIILDAFFYRLRVAGPWRDLDGRFGPWRTIYGWYRFFTENEIWPKILKMMAVGTKSRVLLVDGTHIRVHQSGANPEGGADAQAMGKTKGGRNTKLMMATDGSGRIVALMVVPGQAYEGHYVTDLIALAGISGPLTVVGDKAYDDDKLRASLEALGLKTCFPTKVNRKSKRPMHKGLYRKRFRVENAFCRLKKWASIATRRDKLARNFLSLVTFAAVIDWMV